MTDNNSKGQNIEEIIKSFINESRYSSDNKKRKLSKKFLAGILKNSLIQISEKIDPKNEVEVQSSLVDELKYTKSSDGTIGNVHENALRFRDDNVRILI